ncbi:Na+/H+ antiporter NhaC family protein [Nesterenkonia marinintestina]|uniref:Na+/H+ antiporter NhaC family protein n=1 Tax=Nesterenkonia marinintestina TaxID=2979865 RepID=UPI0021BFCCF4|nr:Na+/H+ antiporter NhaC family protein [Nesterenkonia sp. GX14115]
MDALLNPVLLSVLVLCVLALSGVHVLLALLIAAVVAGLLAGLGPADIFTTLVDGLGGQGETALSYLLLGVLAVMVARSGLTGKLVRTVMPLIRGRRGAVLFALAGLACFSQNLVPVHIAFIPILIPPLLTAFDRMRIDRRAVACALTFGLKAPYLIVPLGFGLIFQGIVAEEMSSHGMDLSLGAIPAAMAIPTAGMLVGLVVAVLVSYRRSREYAEVETRFSIESSEPAGDDETSGDAEPHGGWTWQHVVVLIALAVTLVLQLVFSSLVIAGLGGVLTIFLLRGERWRRGDEAVTGGVAMMGTIAFIMLIASGYAAVLRETGAVEDLVSAAGGIIGDSHLVGALMMMTVGLIVTMGIGTSFGTIPVLAAIFVPLAATLGFSPLATAALIGAAGAIGDAGSPASDSTLGPTSGLNVDGQHDHIWDTCVPTFLHYNIPLFIGGVVAALVL